MKKLFTFALATDYENEELLTQQLPKPVKIRYVLLEVTLTKK
jgi:hypothetical protein